MAGKPFTATLTGPGKFTNGRTSVTGTTTTGTVPQAWTATGTGQVSIKVTVNALASTSYQEFDAPSADEQRVIIGALVQTATSVSAAVPTRTTPPVTVGTPVLTTTAVSSAWIHR